MRFPPGVASVEEISDDWDPPSLGTGKAVRAVLGGLLPGIAYDDSGWGEYEGGAFSIGTPLKEADDQPVTGIGLFVHGDARAAAPMAVALAEALEARAFATGDGEFLTVGSARDSAGVWQGYRDRVVGHEGARERVTGAR
ncbi:hypothetical protein CTZ27_26200 [Streptomyces griseocarneus]|nr:hypothetical protein CTZ27_26200 [Streptomyces griseocarneus]